MFKIRYGHVQRMHQERLPKRILEWCPPGRRRKGRPRNSWMHGVTTGMRERVIGDLEWNFEFKILKPNNYNNQ